MKRLRWDQHRAAAIVANSNPLLMQAGHTVFVKQRDVRVGGYWVIHAPLGRKSRGGIYIVPERRAAEDLFMRLSGLRAWQMEWHRLAARLSCARSGACE